MQRRDRITTATVLLAALLAVPLATLRAQALTGAPAEELVDAMQEGGTVIFLRHAETDQSEIDTGRLGDRPGQRNLDEAGRQQARDLGEAFRKLGISFERILASPVYRARDTAELAFDPADVEVTMDIVADDYAGIELGRMLEATERLLSETPPEGTNLLLIGHRTPLEMVTSQPFPDTVLPEGAMAIFRSEGGERHLLGTLSAGELIAAAEGD